MEIKDLVELITKYSNSYYGGVPEIDDEEFDKLVDQLKELDPDNPVLHHVGYGYQVQSKVKTSHNLKDRLGYDKDIQLFIGSIPKIKEIDSIQKSKELAITPKLDGLSVVLYYKNQGDTSVLYDAVTRGNGYEGQSIKSKIESIVPTELISDTDLVIRGELLLTIRSWKSLNKFSSDYKNPRNAVSGIINSNESSELISYVSFIPYKIIYEDSNISTKYSDDIVKLSKIDPDERINWSAMSQLITLCDNSQITYEQLQRKYDKLSEIFPIDGLVITSNIEVRDESSDGLSHYDEVAFKFLAEHRSTTVKGISWQLTRLKKMVPVVEVEPVELSGATISRASGFNAQNIIDNKIGKGAVVELTRSNEVIPYILDVTKPCDNMDEVIPTKCPECGGDLKMVGVDLYCDNKDCGDYSSLMMWLQVNSPINGLGYNTINKFLESSNVRTIDELYEKLANDDYLKSIDYHNLSITNKKIYDMLFNLCNNKIDITTALQSLNIPRLGYVNSEKFNSEEGFKVLTNLMNGDLSGVEEFATPSVVDSIKSNIHKFKYLKNLKLEIISKTESNSDRIKVCITGKINSGLTKKKFYDKYSDKIEESSVSDADYLIMDIESNSNKVKSARDKGISIITSDELVNIIEGK